MSCFRPRLSHLFVSAVMAIAAGVILAPPTGVAREGHRINHETDIPCCRLRHGKGSMTSSCEWRPCARLPAL